MQFMNKLVVACLLLALVIPVSLFAQGGSTGAITGTVTDEKGGTVADLVRGMLELHGERDQPHTYGSRPEPKSLDGHEPQRLSFQLWPAPRSASADRNNALADWCMT